MGTCIPSFFSKSPHLPHPEDTPEVALTPGASLELWHPQSCAYLPGISFLAGVGAVISGFWGLAKWGMSAYLQSLPV